MKKQIDTQSSKCKECHQEFLNTELHKCPECHMLLCTVCLEIHEYDHLKEQYLVEEEDDDYGRKLNKNNWD